MKKLLVLLLPLLLAACAVPHALPQASDVKAGADEVVVIGKIELVPPLETVERTSHWNVIGEERMFRVWMATGAESKPVEVGRGDPSDFHSSVEADWGKPFMVKMPRRRTYFNGAATYLDGLRQTKLWFPGGVYFDVPAGAQAVYIGTLRYHRNDFNTITRMEVVNEPGDLATVVKGAGSLAQVRTSLLKRAPNDGR